MLGPYLRDTFMLFALQFGARKVVQATFREEMYQYVLGCYHVTSKTPFFARVQRGMHTIGETKVFVLPVAGESYTCMELTRETPCAFSTTPFFVIVFRDTGDKGFTGRLDPNNGTAMTIESQGPVHADKMTWDDMLATFSSMAAVSPERMVELLADSIDGAHRPPGGPLLVKETHRVEDQDAGVDGSVGLDAFRFLVSLVPVGDEVESDDCAALGRLEALRARVEARDGYNEGCGGGSGDEHFVEPFVVGSDDDEGHVENVAVADAAASRPTIACGRLKQVWIEAARKLKPDAYNLHNLMLVTYSLLCNAIGEESLPPVDDFNPPVFCHDLLVHLCGSQHTSLSSLAGNLVVLDAVARDYEASECAELVDFFADFFRSAIVQPADFPLQRDWDEATYRYDESGDPAVMTELVKKYMFLPLQSRLQ